MSFTTLFLRLGAAAVGGAVIGYVFRWLLGLARKGSVEVEVKQKLLAAAVEARRIAEEAEGKAKEVIAAAEASFAEKEEKVARLEERVFKREESLDKKQAELDAQVEAVKSRIEEVKHIKEKAETLVAERSEELARV